MLSSVFLRVFHIYFLVLSLYPKFLFISWSDGLCWSLPFTSEAFLALQVILTVVALKGEA